MPVSNDEIDHACEAARNWSSARELVPLEIKRRVCWLAGSISRRSYALGYLAGREYERQRDWKGWTPTAASVNALPEPLRKYIHDLETNCDPAGLVQQIAALHDQANQLLALLARRVDSPPAPKA
jgi:hypothetical protein